VAVFGGDDELPQALVTGALPPRKRVRDVDPLAARVEPKPRPAGLLGTLAGEVAAMSKPGSEPPPLATNGAFMILRWSPPGASQTNRMAPGGPGREAVSNLSRHYLNTS
jgi:hypothetical protein